MSTERTRTDVVVGVGALVGVSPMLALILGKALVEWTQDWWGECQGRRARDRECECGNE